MAAGRGGARGGGGGAGAERGGGRSPARVVSWGAGGAVAGPGAAEIGRARARARAGARDRLRGRGRGWARARAGARARARVGARARAPGQAATSENGSRYPPFGVRRAGSATAAKSITSPGAPPDGNATNRVPPDTIVVTAASPAVVL